MPKPKQYVKENNKNKKKALKHVAETPHTADDYLAAGVDFEEAGEKWRAGDAAKSTRFFVRALDTYEEALAKFPDSFDLAYNKARVQYELTQHPRLAAQLPGTLLDLLKTALESSRAALNLRQDNADVLFNTAQVLTSLVEALTEDRNGNVPKEESLRMLEEAIELFQRCLTLQEYQFAESQAQEEAAALISQSLKIPGSNVPSSSMTGSESHGIPHSGDEGSSASQSLQEEQWAMIEEPVTNDTLLDTVLAQLETLTTLCELITADGGRGLAWVEEYSSGLLTQKIPAYVKGTDREEEASLTRANFIAALSDANFRSQRLDAPTYARALEDAFGPLDLSHDSEGLCDKAEALITYSSTIGDADPTSTAAARWDSYTAALDALTAASKIPTANNVAKIHLMRGDVELLRYQLSQPPANYPAAARNAATLLKNAATYYRGAEGHVRASGLEDDELKEAIVKQALAAALVGQGERLGELLAAEAEATQKVLEEAVESELVSIEWLIKHGVART